MVTTEDTDVAATEDIDLHAITCSDCGEPMDQHGCPNAAGHSAPVITTVTTRSTGPRKPVTAHPPCPHCAGRIHWNNGQAIVNFECMYRQYLLSTGEIGDPSARLPVLTATKLKSLGDWVDEQAATGTFEYGTMASSGGGATYSAARPKTPRPPKEPKEEKPKRTRAKKSVTEVAAEVEGSGPAEAEVADSTNGAAEPVGPTAEEKAAAEREKRREARQAKLKGLSKV